VESRELEHLTGHCQVEVNQGPLEGNDWVGSVDQSPVFTTPNLQCDNRPLSTDGRISAQLDNTLASVGF
jgi:hypothetical protein